VKAITICQPYAHLIALGEKPIENRNWQTRHRGPILIHAGLSFGWLGEDDRQRFPEMAFGAVVAIAELVACLPYLQRRAWPERFRALGDHEHANGPWCLVLEDVRRLPAPIPCRGERLIWTPPADVVTRVQLVLEAVA
jgi:hypothetical protein